MTFIPLFWAVVGLLIGCSLVFLSYSFVKQPGAYNGAKLSILACALVVSQLSLYTYWGSSQEFVHVKAFQIISKRLESLTQDKDLSVDKVLSSLGSLTELVKYSHKGLARVGSIYSELNRFEEASEVLEKAMELSPSTPDYALQWVYHQSFLHQGKLPPRVRTRAIALLEHDQTKHAARNMIAMDDYFQGNYQAAIDHWSNILQNDRTLTLERRAVLEKALENAKNKVS